MTNPLSRSLRTLQHLDHFPNSCGKSTTRWHDQLRHYSVNAHLRTFKDVTNPQYSSKEVEERAEELLASGKNIYPRYSRHPQSRSIRSLVLEVDSVPTSEDAPAVNNEDLIQVFGRVSSIRTSGSKLVFLDLVEDQTKLQVVLSLSALESRGVSKDEFRQLSSLTRRGDWICKINAERHIFFVLTYSQRYQLVHHIAPKMVKLPSKLRVSQRYRHHA